MLLILTIRLLFYPMSTPTNQQGNDKGGLRCKIITKSEKRGENHTLLVGGRIQSIEDKPPQIRSIETVYVHFYDAKLKVIKTKEVQIFASENFIYSVTPTMDFVLSTKIPKAAKSFRLELDTSGATSQRMDLPVQ